VLFRVIVRIRDNVCNALKVLDPNVLNKQLHY